MFRTWGFFVFRSGLHVKFLLSSERRVSHCGLTVLCKCTSFIGYWWLVLLFTNTEGLCASRMWVLSLSVVQIWVLLAGSKLSGNEVWRWSWLEANIWDSGWAGWILFVVMKDPDEQSWNTSVLLHSICQSLVSSVGQQHLSGIVSVYGWNTKVYTNPPRKRVPGFEASLTKWSGQWQQ